MTDKQMKNYIRRLYKNKTISDIQFRNAVNNLEKLRDSDLFFYYFNMGRLHTAFGNVEDAIYNLQNAIELKPEHASAWYNLYKCYVKSNNIKMAQISFEKFLELNDKDVNFELVANIMNAINVIDNDFFAYLEEDFSVECASKSGYNNLEDNDELKEIYLGVLKAFNSRDYLACLQILDLMNYKINQIIYPMEVDTLIKLIKFLKDKEIEHCRMCLTDDKYKGISDEMYEKTLFRLYELGCYSTESFLRNIEEIILNDSHVKGSIILDKISNLKDFEDYQDIIDYLNGIVREKEAFSLLGEPKQEEFTSKCLVAGRQYEKKQNDLCLESCLALKEEFNLPVCDYYIGKVMFRMGKFSQAKEYFLSYLEQGGTKTEKTYMFLTRIEHVRKNRDASQGYQKKMNRIHEVFLRDFEYLTETQYRRSKKGGHTYSRTSADIVKNNRMRNIRMQEEDFIEGESLPVTDFYNVNVEGKLVIIKNLLRSRDVKTARKLLEEVQKECTPEERPKIKQFQKNQRIYMNQIRNS